MHALRHHDLIAGSLSGDLHQCVVENRLLQKLHVEKEKWVTIFVTAVKQLFLKVLFSSIPESEIVLLLYLSFVCSHSCFWFCFVFWC